MDLSQLGNFRVVLAEPPLGTPKFGAQAKTSMQIESDISQNEKASAVNGPNPREEHGEEPQSGPVEVLKLPEPPPPKKVLEGFDNIATQIVETCRNRQQTEDANLWSPSPARAGSVKEKGGSDFPPQLNHVELIQESRIKAGEAPPRERLQELAKRLKLRRYRNGYRGACPVHSSNSKNSLSIALGNEKSIILMHCFNGCSYKEIYEQISSEHPDILPPKNFGEAPEAVERVKAALSAARLIGRGKATEIDVLLAHIEIARAARSDEYFASVREVAERGKIQNPVTVSRAHCRLVKAGWLRRVERSKNGRPAIWRLQDPERDSQATFCTQYLRTENVALRSLFLSISM